MTDKVKLDRIDIAEASYLAQRTTAHLLQDPATLSNEELIDIRDRDYGILDTCNMGEDDPQFLALVDAFVHECDKRGIASGFADSKFKD
jgi:hypothetical protein